VRGIRPDRRPPSEYLLLPRLGRRRPPPRFDARVAGGLRGKVESVGEGNESCSLGVSVIEQPAGDTLLLFFTQVDFFLTKPSWSMLYLIVSDRLEEIVLEKTA
jgi:hypothetical protein